MFGNGVKRKLDEDGLEEGKALLTSAAGAPGSHSRVNYTLQRQTVLNISLMKLYGPSRTPATEPALQRRVLINNVIRRIQHEFKEEGGAGLRALFFSVPPPVPNVTEDEGYHEAPSSAFGGVLSPPLSPLSSLDSGLTPASLLEDDPPLFFALPPSSPHPLGHHPLSQRPSAPPPPPAKDSFSSALEEIEELCPIAVTTSTTSSLPLSPPPSPQPPPSLPAGMDVKEEGRTYSPKDKESLLLDESQAAKTMSADPLPPPSAPTDMSPSSGGFLTDFALDDILFTDIDTSMYDFNHPCGASSIPPNLGVSKTTPMVTADDLVKTLSSYSGGGAGSPPLAQNQPFKMDLAELDHIMEVLVGS
ncbi:SERTA domain-containing protein 2 [Coregonus clupeaformis]|uniref:SERTA domain-containing protein 2 n=1 Tax=Coregonus clupeaformis TaxID=59861 RepID=UPI001BDFA439|nr:SERTA domain-containing protein 2 [Coregonus clupeaformis]